MPNNSENVTTKFRVDVSDLKKNISDANKSIQRINAEFKNAVAGTDDWSKSADGLSAKIKQQSEIVEQEKKKLQALKDQLSRLNDSQKNGEKIIADLTAKHKAAADAFGEDSEEAKTLAKQLLDAQKAQERNTKAADDLRVKIINQDTAVKNAEGQVRKFSAALDDLQDEENDTNKQTDNLTENGIGALSVALGDLAATAITAVISKLQDMSKAAFDAFKQFDAGRDSLIKATGATGTAADELTAAYSKTAQSVAGDMETIGAIVGEVNTRFGYTGDKLSEVSEDFARFADITGVDGVTAVQNVSRALNSAGMDMGDYNTLLDQLAIASQASGISADTLSKNLTKYGAQMRAVGFDTSEMIALFSQFEVAGVNTESAVTGIRTAVAGWSKDGKNARVEFSSLLEEIKNAPSDTAAAETAVATFGSKAGTELAEVIRSGRFEYSAFADTISKSVGTVDNTFNETQSGLDKINLAIQGVSVQAAEFVGKLIDKYGAGVEDVVKRFSDVLQGVDGAETALGDSVAAIVTNVIQGATDALPRVGTLAAQIVTTLATNLVKHLPEIVSSAGDLVVTVAERLAGFIPEFANTVVNALPSIISAILTLAEKIVSALPKIAETIVKALPKLLQNISRLLITQTPKILQTVKTLFETIVNALPTILNTIVDILPDLIAVFQTLVSELTPEIIDGVLMLLESIIAAYPQLAGTVYELIPKIADTLVTGLFDYVPVLISTFGKIFTSIAKSIPIISKTIWDSMVSVFDSWRKNIFDRAVTAFAEIAKTVKGWFSGLWEDIKRVFSGVGEFFGGIWNTIKEKFTTIGTKIGDAIGGAFKLAINAAIATVERAINGVPSAINAALDLINALPGVNIAKLPNIALPRLARGGVVNGATLAEIGEDGAEAVIPLEKNKKGLKQIAQAISGEMNGGTFGRNGNGGTHGGNVYNFNQTNNSPKYLSRFDIYRQTKNMIDLLKLQGV